MKSLYLKIMGLKIEILRKLTCANLKLNFSTAKFRFQYTMGMTHFQIPKDCNFQ